MQIQRYRNSIRGRNARTRFTLRPPQLDLIIVPSGPCKGSHLWGSTLSPLTSESFLT